MMEKIRAGIYGTCVADALGVPAEFRSAKSLKQDPITDMVSGGAHRQKRGTWSDDSSMMLCLADSLGICGKVDPDDVMQRFYGWYDRGEYSPWGECFDCGSTVRRALYRYRQGVPAESCGGTDAYSNGNGSLMRILPMAYGLYGQYGANLTAYPKAMEQIHLVSALTHGHEIALSACGIYVLAAAKLLGGMELKEAIRAAVGEGLAWYDAQPRFQSEMKVWQRIRDVDALAALPGEAILSGGYVVETMEAALWCLMRTDNFRDAALLAVNLGSDTDTTAAVAGGLAGLAYGLEGIPGDWLDALAGVSIIERCCRNLETYCRQVRG